MGSKVNFYRRTLPNLCIDFSSTQGKQVFKVMHGTCNLIPLNFWQNIASKIMWIDSHSETTQCLSMTRGGEHWICLFDTDFVIVAYFGADIFCRRSFLLWIFLALNLTFWQFTSYLFQFFFHFDNSQIGHYDSLVIVHVWSMIRVTMQLGKNMEFCDGISWLENKKNKAKFSVSSIVRLGNCWTVKRWVILGQTKSMKSSEFDLWRLKKSLSSINYINH